MIRKILGWFLIAAGILALFIPFVWGIPLLIAGLILTGNHHLIDWIKQKFWRKSDKGTDKGIKQEKDQV